MPRQRLQELKDTIAAREAALADLQRQLNELATQIELASSEAEQTRQDIAEMTGRLAWRRLSGRGTWFASLGLILVLALLSTWAIAAGADAGSDHGGAHGAEEEASAPTGRPGFARVDLGGGLGTLQVLIDSSGTIEQVHLTFFDEQGEGLEVRDVSMTGTSPSGDNTDVPVALFEPGHFAASTELSPGDWTFRVQGTTTSDQTVDVSFPLTVG